MRQSAYPGNPSREVAQRARTPRLSDVLFEPSARRFGSLAALPSNVHAIEEGLLFATHLSPFVAIVGPSGWGKSHLLDCVAYRLAQDYTTAPPVQPALEWLTRPRIEPHLPLLLDDVQEVISRTRARLQLRMALERRVRGGRPTILAFTAADATRQIRAFLPSPRDWVISTMGEPEPTERLLVVNQMANANGLVLSTALTQLLAYRMQGNGRTLAGALNRLKLHGTHWLDVHATLRACGVLDPFFVDCCEWDLKERIVRITDQIGPRFPGVSLEDLAVYLMLREACFPEADVARYFRIEMTEVYVRAGRIQAQLVTCDKMRACVAQFVETVVDGILYD
jgi:hypothetical protein